MCLPWCCHPYTDVYLKDPPPKKKEEEEEERRVNHTVDNQAPALIYTVGFLNPPSPPPPFRTSSTHLEHQSQEFESKLSEYSHFVLVVTRSPVKYATILHLRTSEAAARVKAGIGR